MSKVLYVRVPEETHEEIARVVKDHGSTITEVVNRALVFYLTEKCGWKRKNTAGLP